MGAVVVDILGVHRVTIVGNTDDALDGSVGGEEGVGAVVEGLGDIRAAPVPFPAAVGLGVGFDRRDEGIDLGLLGCGQGNLEAGGNVRVGDIGHTL